MTRTPDPAAGAAGPSPDAPPPARPIRSIRRGPVEAIMQAGTAIGAGLVMLGFLCVIAAVTMRYLVSRPIAGVDEFNGYLLVAVTVLGLGGAMLRGEHIAIDLFTGQLRGRARRATDLIAALAVLLFAGMLGWSAWHTAAFNRGFGTYSNGPLEIPIWWAQAVMVPGAALLGLAALVVAVRVWRATPPAAPHPGEDPA